MYVRKNQINLGLYPNFLCEAYARGYFPMPDPETEEVVWMRPDPRAILPLDKFHCSRSLQKIIRKSEFTVSINQAFSQVMEGCSDRKDTWINDEFKEAYLRLHNQKSAHSIEVWEGSKLVGGVYGVSIGGAFFAESKFHRKDNASKVALFHLVEHLKSREFELLEVQFLTPHLENLGAIVIPDWEYQLILQKAIHKVTSF